MVRARLLALGLLLLATPAAARSPKVGEPAPPATITTYDGQKITLADLKGQVVVLNFWATWCGPCRAEMPLLDAAARQKADKGLRIFAVATEDSVPPIYLKKLAAALAFPLVRRMRGAYDAIGSAVPTNYVIDRAGIVRYAQAGAFTPESMNATLMPLLREPAPVPLPVATVAQSAEPKLRRPSASTQAQVRAPPTANFHSIHVAHEL